MSRISLIQRHIATIAFLLPGLIPSVFAYDVEADSVGNSVYILLKNTNPAATFDSVSLSENSPSFVSSATATILPASVPVNGSDLAALDFNIAPGTLVGTTGNLVITASGTAASQPVEVVMVVPLEVVASAAIAQGVIGSTIPVADEGGVDSDMDGVTDALEMAFGSDAFFAGSTPVAGGLVTASVPIMGALGLLVLAGLLTLFKFPQTRRWFSVGAAS